MGKQHIYSIYLQKKIVHRYVLYRYILDAITNPNSRTLTEDDRGHVSFHSYLSVNDVS